MEGTGPPCFASLACCDCQANKQAPRLQGSGPTPTLTGKSVTSFVPSSMSSVSVCGLLQSWGSCVRVVESRRAAHNDGRIAPRSALGYVNILIDLRDSMVGNPFVGGPPERLNSAFDELLGHVLAERIDFDSILSDYYRLRDEHRSGTGFDEPATRRLLLEISTRHGVELDETRQQLLSVDAVRAWVAHYSSLMLAGQSFQLLCHCGEGPCSHGDGHGRSLAGALLWTCRGYATVRHLLACHCCSPAPFSTPCRAALSCAFSAP